VVEHPRGEVRHQLTIGGPIGPEENRIAHRADRNVSSG
jgi:hypothetical protein